MKKQNLKIDFLKYLIKKAGDFKEGFIPYKTSIEIKEIDPTISKIDLISISKEMVEIMVEDNRRGLESILTSSKTPLIIINNNKIEYYPSIIQNYLKIYTS